MGFYFGCLQSTFNGPFFSKGCWDGASSEFSEGLQEKSATKPPLPLIGQQENISSLSKDDLSTYYNLNLFHFRNQWTGLSSFDKMHIVALLGSQILDTDPQFAIENASLLPLSQQKQVLQEGYKRWLDLDPEAAVEPLLKAGFGDDEILQIARHTSCQDVLVLAKLIHQYPKLLDDLDVQLQILLPTIEAVRSNDTEIFAKESNLTSILRTAEMVVHPEALVEVYKSAPDVASQLDLERLTGLSLFVDTNNFKILINEIPTIELKKEIVDVALKKYATYPEQLLDFFRSIADANLANSTKQQFYEAIQIYSQPMADKLLSLSPQ